MIHNEQILEYIDGMLDPESEQALFDALARQPELRAAMRQFICIGEAVRADREAYAPPAEVERSLMAGIGLSPAELGFVAPSVGIIERLGMLGGRYLGMIGAFILGVLLASVTVYQIVDVDGGDERGSAASHGSARGGTAAGGTVAGGTASSKNGTTMNGGSAADDRGAAAGLNNRGTGVGSSIQSGAGAQGAAASQGYGGNASSSASAPRVAETNIGSNDSRSSRTSPRSSRSSLRETARMRSGNEALSSPAANNGNDIASSERANGSSERSTIRSTTSTDTRTSATSDGASRNEGVSLRDREGGISSPPREESAAENGSSMTSPNAVAVESAKLRRSRADIGAASEYEGIAANRSPSSVALESMPASSLEIEGSESDGGRHGALLEVRGQIGWSLNESNARTIGSAGRTSFAGGAYWQPVGSLALGVEGGMESYDQTLRYRNSDTLQIDQRPTYLWGGATLRYYLGALSINELAPYVQTTLGGTSAGPVLRFRLGTEYDLGINMAFTLSGEFSALFYSFDEQRLTSGRWGLTTGLQYNIR